MRRISCNPKCRNLRMSRAEKEEELLEEGRRDLQKSEQD